MFIETLNTVLRRMRITNTTDNGHPSRIIRATEPTGKGDDVAQAVASAVIETARGSGMPAQNEIVLVPFGAGADLNTFLMRVIGWNKVTDGADAEKDVWVPTTLGEFTCTMSTPVGLANKVVIATDRFCDTIAIVGTSGTANVTFVAISPANDTIATVAVSIQGCQKVEVTFSTGGVATSCNALWRLK